MKTKRYNGIRVLMGSLLLSVSLSVSALPMITGNIGMGGGFDPVDSTGAVTSLDLATGIDFNPNMFRVTSNSTGDFAALAGQIGSIQDFQFVGFTGPVVDFWSVGGFSFDLTSVNTIPTGDPSQFLALEGFGTISAAGYQDTLGRWSFSGNGPTGIFTWSAGSSAVGVPEPMALALIGIGLVGFGVRGLSRRRG